MQEILKMKRTKDNFFLISEKTKRQLIDEQFKLSKIAFVLECSTILEFISSLSIAL